MLISRIYGQSLRRSSLAVLVALLIGGELLGIGGALLALRGAAGLRVVIEQLRIDLPGEQPGEATQRTLDAAAEATYAEQTEGVSARDAAGMTTRMAEQGQEDELVALEQIELRSEEPADTTPIRFRGSGMVYAATDTFSIRRPPLPSTANETLVRAAYDADSANGAKE